MLPTNMAKAKNKTIFTCQNCGAQRPRWEGKCSDCGSWNSFQEETLLEASPTKGWALGTGATTTGETTSLDQPLTTENKMQRWSTTLPELDRVLGGGLAKGSFVLLGGAPGIGKSTLLMQVAGGLSQTQNKDILYISGEESVAQTASRAHRLGIRAKSVRLGAESNLHRIIDLARKSNPAVLVVDSIQTVFHPDIQSAPGSVSQVRECAGHLMSLAKNDGITVILIGHVTKDGHLAGPKVLEHMVDCVLSFEGDLAQHFRMIRALKNRFGAALEMAVFEMAAVGLKEVANPSQFFLEERSTNAIGSSVFAAMEGTRTLLCEIQALTVNTPQAMPRRTSLGIELNRVHLLTAVMERHLGIEFSHLDVYLNVVGGLRLEEPATDLAAVASLISSWKNVEIPKQALFFGEIGLTGEVRATTFAENRVKEGEKLGFQEFFLPASNKKQLQDYFKANPTLRPRWIAHVRDLLTAMNVTVKKTNSSNQVTLTSKRGPVEFTDF